MPDSAGIRLVCFDLGGVVVRICRSWDEGCHHAGLDVRGDVDGIRSSTDRWQDLHTEYQSGLVEFDDFLVRFSAVMAGLYTPEEIGAIHAAWLLGEYPGVDALVERVHVAGVTTAVLSNTCHAHWRDLVQYPAIKRIDHLVGSHLVAACKPAEAAYRALETRTGRRGDEILFFDDTSVNVEAARGLGWHAEEIDPSDATAEQMTRALESYGVLSRQRFS